MNVRHPMGVLHSFSIMNIFFMIKWIKAFFNSMPNWYVDFVDLNRFKNHLFRPFSLS